MKSEIPKTQPDKNETGIPPGSANRLGMDQRMRRIILTCMAIAVFLGIGLYPAAASAPTVTISEYHVTPAVLMPGDTGTISFTIMTTDQAGRVQESTPVSASAPGKTQSSAINVFINKIHVEGNGITILTGDFDRVGDLGPGQSLPITVLIQAPEKTGMYFPEVWIDTGTEYGLNGQGTSTRYPIPVNVNTRISLQKKPDISLRKILPASVVPGNSFPAHIQLQNDGTGRADDIFIAINPTGTGLSLESPANYHLDHLDPGENSSFDLILDSSKDTPTGIRTIPVTVSYANADGTKGTLSDQVGISMKGNATIAIKSLTTDPVRPTTGAPITLVMRIENTGTDRATSVKAELATALSGPKETFIGSIDKNSDAPAVFYLKSSQSGDIPVGINLTYTDDYGIHLLHENVTVTVERSTGAIGVAIAILLIIAAGAGAYWYLHIRKKGDHA